MSNDTARTRPNFLQYIGYCYGRRLPDSMRDWVRNDLAGKGATDPDDGPGLHPGGPDHGRRSGSSRPRSTCICP